MVLELIPFVVPSVSITRPVEAATLTDAALKIRCTATTDTPGFPGTPVIAWSQLSGPGSVVFDNPAALDTLASFSVPGTYQLQCSATFNGLTGTAIRMIRVAQPSEISSVGTLRLFAGKHLRPRGQSHLEQRGAQSIPRRPHFGFR